MKKRRQTITNHSKDQDVATQADAQAVSAGSRKLLAGSAALAGVACLGGLGFPAIVRAQSDKIKIGHLTPLTGFLGPLGEYAVMSITMAVEEVNRAGGVMGRQLELISRGGSELARCGERGGL